jgi:hypothetical protein
MQDGIRLRAVEFGYSVPGNSVYVLLAPDGIENVKLVQPMRRIFNV